MTDNKYSQRIPRRTWDTHKDNILRLYVSENRPLIAVKDMMHAEYGFSATKSQYETRLKKWSCYKYAAAHDRRNRAPALDNQTTESLVTERHTRRPESDASLGSHSSSRSLPIRTPSPQLSTLQPSPLNHLSPSILLGLADCWHDFTSLSVRSIDLQSSTFQRESELLVPQNPTWPSNIAMAANDLLSEDSESLSCSSHAIYARGFIRQNDVRSANLDSFPGDSTLRETIHPGGFSMPDFATSMFPVISRMFPRAVSSPHLVILGNSNAFESALKNMSHPSTLQFVHQQSIDHQIIYMIFHRLVNDSDAVQALDEPKTELDQIFKTGVIHCFSLGKRGLSSLISSTPSSFIPALTQNIFRAALILGNGEILRYVLEMNQASFANQSFFLGGAEYYPLEYACQKGHIQTTKALLDHSADPNWQTPDYGRTPLRVVLGLPSENRDRQTGVQILRLLIDHGLESQPMEYVNRMSISNKDELLILATHCLDKSFETFIEYYGLPVLLLQLAWDDPFSKTLKAILDLAFSELNGRRTIWDSVLSDSLSAAILRSRASAVDTLLSMGATPDIHCLISAAQSNDVHVLKDLLSRGLDPNTVAPTPIDRTGHDMYYHTKWKRERDCTALSESIVNRSRGAFQVLYEQGFVSSVSNRPIGFASAFVAACHVGDSILLQQFLSMPNFPRRQRKLEQAIKAAIDGDQYHIVEKLLSVGMKPSLRSLELAFQKRKLTTAILLARYMSDTVSLGVGLVVRRVTILWEALRWGDQTAIELVLKMGHPVNVCDRLREETLKNWDLLPEVRAPDIDGHWRYTPLSAVILDRNTTAVKTLMAYGAHSVCFSAHDTSHKYIYMQHPSSEEQGWILTPLAAAIVTNDLHLISEILRIGADPFDNSALFVCAMIDSQDEVVALLLSAFRTRYPDGARSFGSDALYQTIRRGNARLLRLLAKDVDLTGRVKKHRKSNVDWSHMTPDTVYTSPLGEAVRRHADSESAGGMLDYLLPLIQDHDVIVHKSYKHGVMTPLLYAISLGSLATVRRLHQAGANISLPAEWQIDRTPLQAASKAGSKDIVEYLLREGADPNEPPAVHAGATAIQLAAITGKIGVAAVLLDAGADINAPPAFCDGRTAFEGATEHGRIEMMIFLVSRGADLLSNGNVQHRRAVEFAECNAQHAARKLADELYKQVLASQVMGSIDMGRDAWAGPDMNSFGGFLS